AIASPEVDVVAEIECEARLRHITSRIRRRNQAVLRVFLSIDFAIESRRRLTRPLRARRLRLRRAQTRLRYLERRAARERLVDESIELRIAVTPPPGVGRPRC